MWVCAAPEYFEITYDSPRTDTLTGLTLSGRVPHHRTKPGALDKNEGSVKDKSILGSAEAPLFSPERLRTKTLEISRQSLYGGDLT